MNFGPINQRGGEKRLNVIFSRAKHHMAMVSSIRHHDITNDYNDGANSLKNFLHYAEAVSKGDEAAARRVLENLNPLSRKALAPLSKGDAVVEQSGRGVARARLRGGFERRPIEVPLRPRRARQSRQPVSARHSGGHRRRTMPIQTCWIAT